MAIAIRSVTVAAALALFAGAAHAQELVTNGGFETGDFTGWTATAASNGSIFGVTTGFGHSGNATTIWGAIAGEDDTMSQMLATMAGQQYTLSFYHTGFGDGGDHLGVWWEGQLVLDMPPLAGSDDDGSGWLHVTLNLTATGNGSELRFGAFDGPWYGYVDDVSVTPTPGAAALLGLGGLALGRRRR